MAAASCLTSAPDPCFCPSLLLSRFSAGQSLDEPPTPPFVSWQQSPLQPHQPQGEGGFSGLAAPSLLGAIPTAQLPKLFPTDTSVPAGTNGTRLISRHISSSGIQELASAELNLTPNQTHLLLHFFFLCQR